MDKEKIISLATNLVSDTNDALIMRDQSLLQYCKDCEKQIIEEVNSKIKMPKVFDDFAKNFNLKEQGGDGDFYCKCVNALINGYEVEE